MRLLKLQVAASTVALLALAPALMSAEPRRAGAAVRQREDPPAARAASAEVAGSATKAESPSAGEDPEILALTSYWRCYYVLRPARFCLDQWKTIDLPNPGRSLKPFLDSGRDLSKLPDHCKVLPTTFSGHMGTSRLMRLINSPAPPPDWPRRDFNDVTWPRMRYPLLTHAVDVDEGPNHNAYKHGLARGCFRGKFFVADPAKVTSLTVRLVYRGGVRVWVNGKELARGHLPPGPLTADVPAAPYPEAAYALPPAPGEKEPRGVVDIGGPYRQRIGAGRGYFNATLTPKEWNRILALRDRVLGPAAIPKELLVQGVNVLAIEVARADYNPVVTLGRSRLGSGGHYGWNVFERGYSWSHGALVGISLRAKASDAVRPSARPGGVQVWSADVNQRTFNRDFGEPGNCPRVLRLVGARRGRYSAQLLVGTDRELKSLAAVVGPLTGPGGATIPAEAGRVLYAAPRPIADLHMGGVGRGVAGHANLDDLGSYRGARGLAASDDTWFALWRYAARDADGRLPFRRLMPYRNPDGSSVSWHRRKENSTRLLDAMQQIRHFDELSPRPPAVVPADACRAIWLTVRIPEQTPAGLYTGVLNVTADGMAPQAAPVRVQVLDWSLPDPTKNGEDFTTFVAMEQSPWGVAKVHKVAPWSEQHWRHVAQSLKRMGELGNDALMIPVLTGTEFGNRDDSFIVWVKDKAGRLSCDFTRLERYLDLALRHMVKPRVVCFVVATPTDNYLWVVPKVLMRDETTGKTAPATVPMGEFNPFNREGKKPHFTPRDRAAAKALYKPLVEGLLRRMKARGLADAVFWGYLWDYTNMQERYKEVFAELAPQVLWARGSHGHGGIAGKQGMRGGFGCVGTIVDLPEPVRRTKLASGRYRYEIQSHKGWKNKLLHFSIPRIQDAVLCLEGRSVPFMWRIYPELALVGGAIGIGRIGVDYWDWTYRDGWRGGGQVGMGVKQSFWPAPAGEDRARTSARYEMLREGLEAAEARVAIERALEGEFAKTDAGRRAQAALDARIMATLHVPRSIYSVKCGEQYVGWQERSWDLYAASAEAAGGKPPTPAEREAFFCQD